MMFGKTRICMLVLIWCVASLARVSAADAIEWEATGLNDACVVALATNGNNLFSAIEQTGGNDTMIRSIKSGTDSIGTTWTLIANGLPDTLTIYDIATTSTATVLIATSDGVYRSTDSGDTWTAAGLQGEEISAILITPAMVYAGGVGAVYHSASGTGSWTANTTGLAPTAVIFALAADNKNGILYAAGGVMPGGGRIYKSTDNGATFTQVYTRSSYEFFYSLAVDSAGRVFAGSQQSMSGRVYRSSDQGGAWTQVLTCQAVEDLVVAPNDELIVAAGAAGSKSGVLSSVDAGAHWVTYNSGLASTYVYRVAIPKDEKLYVGTYETGVYRSKFQVPVQLSTFRIE